VQASGPVIKGQQPRIEPSLLVGHGGVVVTSDSSGPGAASGPEKLAADSVVSTFAPGAQLSALDGTGHASFEQRTAEGAHQSSTSDALSVKFRSQTGSQNGKPGSATAGSEIASVVQLGNVILAQDPEPGAKTASGSIPQSIKAWANRLDYDGASELMHLTGIPGTLPRVRNSSLEMTATRIDFSRATSDAFGHGDVKASWTGSTANLGNAQPLPGSTLLGSSSAANDGPVHAIAAEAELHQKSGEIVFRAAPGAAARLWREGNSVTAPLIVLNRLRQTLTAQSQAASNPVRTVLVGNPPKPDASAAESKLEPAKSRSSAPNVIRVKSGDLHYSDGERLAIFTAAGLGPVTVESSQNGSLATVTSDRAEVTLFPAGVHGPAGTAASGVDRMVSLGAVNVNWPGRKGIGEKLVYTSDDANYTLTGTSAAPPKITDQARGTVTGSALIFHSRDDSVTVEGDGGKTVTETRSPK
jgi:lipopolysaccharide export system protein LptA